MRFSLPTGAASVTLALVLAITMSGTAIAYFSSKGTGNALVSVSKLSTPTATATQATDGTVEVGWAAVAPPGTGAVTYSVTRDGSSAGGTCPNGKTTATSCVDGGLTIGTHSYVVTANWRSWSTTSSTTVKVTPGQITHFDLQAASTTPIAGAADNLTITAQDGNDNTVTTYTGSHNLVFSGALESPSGTKPTVGNSGGTAVNFGSTTAITFTAGVAKTTSSTKNGVMKLYKSEVTSVKVSEGSVSSSPDLALTVATAATPKISLAVPTTTPVAGTTNNLTITVSDAYGNPITTYTGSRDLTFSGASASPGGNTPTVSDSSATAVAFGGPTPIEFDAGVANVSAGSNGVMTLYKPGSSSLKVSDGTLTSATAAVTVIVAPASRFTLAGTATMTAGGTNSLTVTAFDPYGNTATTYTGLHDLTFSGSSASPTGTLPTVVNSTGTVVNFGSATTINFSSGAAKVSSSQNGVMRLYRSGAASIAVSDGTISTTTPLAVTVNPGAAARWAFSNVNISGGVLGSSCLFACSVTGLGNSGTVIARINVTDSLGNTANAIGTGHTVKITTTGGTIVGTPLTIANTGPAESTATFTFTAKTSGTYSETITAATNAGTNYTSATLTASR
jgi:hypothetical protein